MPFYRIFCDFPFSEDDLDYLKEKVSPHKVVLAETPSESAIAAAQSDPGIVEADVAFGQPAVEGIRESKKLRLVQISSAGFTRYDNDPFRALAKDRGFAVCNSSDVHAEACAEHVFAFMLAQSRALPRALASAFANGSPPWNELRNASVPLKGQTVVILGYGAIGTRLTEMLAPFHMHVIAMRRNRRGDEPVEVVTPETLPCALTMADHVINILPDNAASAGFISAQRLGEMKAGAVFYNIGRGTTVDQAALYAALHSGHLAAAWLDVTDPEPLPADHPLRTLPNCYITPHTAGGHRDEARTLIDHFVGNLRRSEKNEPLVNRIM
jgi:phosphoglycerate dehydrogenase-like enzyme